MLKAHFLFAFTFGLFAATFYSHAGVTVIKLDPKEELQDQRELLLAAQEVLAYFQKNPGQLIYHASRADLRALQQAVKAGQLTQLLHRLKSPSVVVRDTKGKSSEKMLSHPIQGLIDIGLSIRAQKDRANLLSAYAELYQSLPAKVSVSLRHPNELQRATVSVILKHQRLLEAALNKSIGQIIAERIPAPAPYHNPMNISVTRERGFIRSDAFVGDTAAQCAAHEYHPKGLVGQTRLGRDRMLTSVKNQARRGTCTSFAIASAVETEALLKGRVASNLSEQAIYGWAKYMVGGKSSDDGLNVEKALKKMKKHDFRIGLEPSWQYNQSQSRQEFNGTTYPFACSNYSDTCSGRAMQLIQVNGNWAGNFGSTGPSIKKRTSLLSVLTSRETEMNKLIALKKPAIIAITIDKKFFGSVGNSDGYLDWNATHPTAEKGGHAMMYVGYVSNDKRPSGVRAARGGGYVVIKNSWGTNRSDCGFIYLDHDYVKDRLKSIHTITI